MEQFWQWLVEKIIENKRLIIALAVLAMVLTGVNVAAKKSETVSRFLASLSNENSNATGSHDQAAARVSRSGAAGLASQSDLYPHRECAFETAQKPETDKVLFKEVAWMGDKESPNNEWLTIQKVSAGNLDVSGYQILNENQKIKIILPAKTILTDAKPLYVLARQFGAAGGPADATYSGGLRNTHEGLRLFNSDCRLLDEVLAKPDWPAGDNDSKQTMKRDLGTLAWFSVLPAPPLATDAGGQNAPATPTPTANPAGGVGVAAPTPAAVPITTPAAGAASSPWCLQNNLTSPTRTVLINEIAWAGEASDKTTREWVELKNTSGAAVALTGWQLLNKSATIKILFDASDTIAANNFFLLERGGADTIPGLKADKIFTGAIKNNDESLRLFDSACRLVDEVIANVGNNLDWPAGTAAPDYRTAERSADLSWQTYAGGGRNGIFGTPRVENSLPPPLISVSAPPAAPPADNSAPPAPVYYPLAVAKSGAGAGSVTGPSISCDANCVEDSDDYLSGTTIQLTAAATDNSEFAGWNGACAGTGTCQLTMNAAQTVGAVFNLVAAPAAEPPPAEPPSPAPPRVLLAEIMPRGTSDSDEFIVLYNAGGQTADLTGWTIKKRNSKGTESDFVAAARLNNKIIPAGRYFLLANDGGYTGLIAPDAVWAHSYTMAYTTSTAIIVYDKNGRAIDTAAWNSVPAGKSYARVSWDSGDFIVQDTPSPRNSSSL